MSDACRLSPRLPLRRAAAAVRAAIAVIVAAVSVTGCGDASDTESPRVLVLGIDGMDPVLLDELMRAGRMPNFSAVAKQGTFTPLGTSAPPQSPVAWSNFIAGADPSTHQIFDFIHREPAPTDDTPLVVQPYLSTSRIEPPARDWTLSVGRWSLPLFGGKTVSLRRGDAFWNHLVAHGVDTTVYRVPANYPPPESVTGDGRFRCLCGMGTPDLMGTYGLFTRFTSNPVAMAREVSGGSIRRVRLRRDRGTAKLVGPENYLRRDADAPPLSIELRLVRDADADVVKIVGPDFVVVLNEGEWSDWVAVSFETELPGGAVLQPLGVPTSLPAIVRFHVIDVHPHLELYVSPLNLDPAQPANPVSAPGSFAEDLHAVNGPFYTAGIPEDTKALRSGALDEDAFLQQVEVLVGERDRQFAHALSEFDGGFLFFYFGHVDLLSHMFWRDRDPGHPGHDSDEAGRYGTVIEDAYVEMDRRVGEARAVLDEQDTIVLMSDHGFTSFRHGFHLNAWLRAEGYLEATPGSAEYLTSVDWSKTRAYALGLNALYVNQRGRERQGIVAPEDRATLLEEIATALEEVRDADGNRVIDTVYIVDAFYPGADEGIAPDLLIGYARTYRASWATAEGGVPDTLLEDNHDRWSGDHCIAHHLVPGILVTNRSVAVDDPDLTDLAPTILAEYGIQTPPTMTGRAIFRPRVRSSDETVPRRDQ